MSTEIENTVKISEEKSVDEKTNWLLSVLTQSTNEFIQVKELKINDDFFDKELEEMRVEKNRLYKLAQYSNEHESVHKWHNYREFKNQYKDVIQNKKFEVNQNKLNEANGDTKQTWKVLNSILHKEKNEILTIKDGENFYETDDIIVNKFNEFFKDSIVQLNQNIPQIKFEHSTTMIPTSPIQFKFRGISIADIVHCCRELKKGTDEFFNNECTIELEIIT